MEQYTDLMTIGKTQPTLHDVDYNDLTLFIFEGHKHRSIVDHFPSKEKVYYNFFSSNSCNFISGSSRTKEDCPRGYVFCKNATESTGFTLFESLITFKEAEIRCKALNTTICKELLFLR